MPKYPSRREMLYYTGGMMAAAAAKAQTPAAAVSPIMMRLSTFMSAAAAAALPAEVVEKTKHMILDTLAAMISGSELPPGKFAINFARAYKGDRVATVAGSNILCGPIEAALANGMLAHSDETDDTHPPSQSHPGCATVPAALAAGERFNISGRQFLRAVTLGYDVGTRVTATLGRLQYMFDSHRSTHSIAGTFCAAAAAGCAASLNARQMRWLLSYTAQQASGTAAWQRDTDHIEKAFDFAGMPARNGVTSALLVQAGGTGVEDIFSGADNFFDAFLPKNDPSMVIDKLGERYEISRTNIKKWTVGSPIQAPLDALEILMKRHKFQPDEVRQIVVRAATNEAKIVDNREIPDICMQHMVAVMLIDKTASFKSAHDTARMKDPSILRQRAKVQLVGDAELEKLMPRRVGIVEVTLNDGMRFTERVENVRGTLENPMPREEVIAKARDLITPVLGATTSAKLIDKVFDIENVKSVLELRPLIQKA
ncbi:MAG TPA: MmgE/PrpD family protein [Bryobacteraceae bacterium]|nr:MmgE/PrpD family protein [Bryobacteraceae bacterium]